MVCFKQVTVNSLIYLCILFNMMTLSNWNTFRVTGPVTGEFPAQKPVTRSFDVFFDLRLIKRLSEQSWGWWFETPSLPLWCHCYDKSLAELDLEMCAAYRCARLSNLCKYQTATLI